MDIEATSPVDSKQVIPNRHINTVPSYAIPMEEFLYGLPTTSNIEEDSNITEGESEYEWFFPPFMKSQMQQKGEKKPKKKDKKEDKHINLLSKDAIGIIPSAEEKKKRKKEQKKKKANEVDLDEMMQIAIDAKF